MEFKIDTNSNYIHISPLANSLDAKMTEAITQKLADWHGNNLIIDLSNCTKADKEAFPALVHLHADCYSGGQSLVFTGVNDAVLQLMKETGTDQALNIAPTHIEAIDIISMEILERDLFNEEG
jgi:anti-anti-sigma regulatory factor